MNEAKMHKTLKESVEQLANLQRTTHDKFCSYDAFNNRYTVEYKSRRKFFHGSTQIEKMKFDKNTRIDGKEFLYVVFDGVDKVQVWNVSKLAAADYDFKWRELMCPKTTDFSNNEKIAKMVGELKWTDAIKTIQVKEKN